MSPPKDPVKLIEYIKKQRESHLGSKNHNYKPKVVKICPICNQSFPVKLSHSDQICCSKRCMGIRKSQTNCGTNNPFFGKTHSPEIIENIRVAQTGRVQLESTRKKRSESNKKVVHTKEWRENQSKALAGREITWTDKISAAHQGLSLEEWEGFITPLYQKIRASPEYDTWRRAVFERDNYCDWFSGIKSTGNLNAHHIVPFAVILEQNNIKTFEEALNCAALWNVANGVTMIDTVHTAYHQMW